MTQALAREMCFEKMFDHATFSTSLGNALYQLKISSGKFPLFSLSLTKFVMMTKKERRREL